ncbi:MAG: hypothetical protein KAK04_19600, partial [Cyclobacteriaceae bacterium]|nr:hypothetical protein [Cyclobacteriaceae bacterium]
MAIGTKKVSSSGSSGTGVFEPVQDVTALKGLDTTDDKIWKDKWTILVEGEGNWYRLDRDSADTENQPKVVSPTTGVGRWIKIIEPVFEDLTGFALPDSSAIRVYANNESNAATYGRLYNKADAPFTVPPGWRLPTESEIQAITPEAGFPLAGKWAGTYQSLGSWLNAWVATDSDPNALIAYYGQAGGASQGVWAGEPTDCYSLMLVCETDDGRAINATASETISGDSYTTKKLSDGLIWVMKGFRGLKLNRQKRLVLSPDQVVKFEDDIPEPHTHPKSEVDNLRDDSYVEDVSDYLVPRDKRYIDVLNKDTGAFQSRIYTLDSIKAALPIGFRIPTYTDWKNLLIEAGYTPPAQNNPFLMPVAAMTALKTGGAVGIDLKFNGFFTTLDKDPDLHVNRIYNRSVKEDKLSGTYGNEDFYIYNAGNGSDNMFVMGDTTIYDQLPSEFVSNYQKDQLLGPVRFIKEDGVLGGGTVDINGT